MTRAQVAYLSEVRCVLRSRLMSGALKPAEVLIALNCMEQYIRPRLATVAIARYRNQHADAWQVVSYMRNAKSKRKKQYMQSQAQQQKQKELAVV